MNTTAMNTGITLLVLAMLFLVGCTANKTIAPVPSATPAPLGGQVSDDTGEETMPIIVTVQVSPTVALALHEQKPSRESEGLLEMLDDLGVTMTPLHPGARDPLLTPFFIIEAADQATAETIIERLSRSEVVEGAYIKPPEALP